MIKKIIIEKFRSIESLELDIQPLTILVGKNNVGKSNIIDALRVAFDEESQFEKNKDGFSFDSEREKEFKVKVILDDKTEHTIPSGKSKKDKTIKLEQYEFLYISAEYDIKDPCSSREMKNELAKIFELAFNDITLAEEKIQKQLNGILENSEVVAVLDGMNKYLEDWDSVKVKMESQKPSFKKLIDYYVMKIIESDKEINSESLGSGLKRSIIASVLNSYAQIRNKNSKKLLIFFEEPELFLHPWQLKQLKKDLRKLANDGHIIMATSHSPQFISPEEIKEWSYIVKVIKNNNVTEVNKLEEIKPENFPNPSSMNFNPMKYMVMIDKERSQLFFCDKLIIVEGWTEKAFFEKLSFEEEIKGKNFYILETSGKDNIVNMVNIIKTLKLKIFIVYDADKNKNLDLNINIDALCTIGSEIKIHKFDIDLEHDLIREEDLVNYDKEWKALGRNDLKPAFFLNYYEEGKLNSDKLKLLIDKINEFLSN